MCFLVQTTFGQSKNQSKSELVLVARGSKTYLGGHDLIEQEYVGQQVIITIGNCVSVIETNTNGTKKELTLP